MKNDQEKLYHHRWGSNNSFEAKVGMDYSWHASQSAINGEPGYIWLDNARYYGRMKDGKRYDDVKVMGFNPCVEQQLENGELCCLVETYPAKHESYEDYKKNEGHTINHFYEKLLLLKERMNTNTGKRIAEGRHKFMQSFLDQFYREWDGIA